MSAPKSVVFYGLLAKAEASYGAGGTLAAATDGVLLAEPGTARIGYLDLGRRGRAAGGGGEGKLATPTGREVELACKTRWRGPGSAYSASVRSEADILRRIAGLSATVSGAGPNEIVTYAPIAAAFTSAVLELYAAGELWKLIGGYGDYGWVARAGGFLEEEFTVRGVLSTAPTDVAVPAITYLAPTHPKIAAIAFNVGAIGVANFKVRELEFRLSREMERRADANGALAGGHAGWAMGGYTPELVATFEGLPVATYNPYADWEAGTTRALTCLVGTANYNQRQFDAAQAQIVDVERDGDGPAALWRVRYLCASSTDVLDNGFTLIDT